VNGPQLNVGCFAVRHKLPAKYLRQHYIINSLLADKKGCTK